VKFIHAADLHVDSPLWGLDNYDGAPVERLRGATRQALEALVDFAIEQKVDFVIFAGDIFDGEWRDFRTGLFFRDQMRRLTLKGIRVFVAKGNHDAESQVTKELPLLDGLHFFTSQRCESIPLELLNCVIHGRSFPKNGVDGGFADSYPPAVSGKFNIGVLHTSLAGNPDHPSYAPTSVDVLTATGYDYFALGHIHAHQVICERHPRIVYPGNLQGRHAKEIGPKGCELVTVEGDTIVETEFVALDVVRWHHLHLDVSGISDVTTLHRRFLEQAAVLTQQGGDRLHAVRIFLDGETELSRVEAQHPGTLAAAIQAAAQDTGEDNLWVEQIKTTVRMPIERNAFLERQDALGDVVRLTETITADDVSIKEWVSQHVADLNNLPADLKQFHLDALDANTLRQMLVDAEATVLAHLSNQQNTTESQ
jgi:DNA repair protein SbcD/Mre11